MRGGLHSLEVGLPRSSFSDFLAEAYRLAPNGTTRRPSAVAHGNKSVSLRLHIGSLAVPF